MNGLDYLLLAVVAVSALMGLRRGLVSEVLSLAGWVVSFILARQFATQAGQWLPLPLPGDEVRWLLGFIGLMLASWLGFFIVRQLLAGVLRVTGLSGVDRFFGMGFGLVRGLLAVTLGVLLAGLTSWPNHPVWQASALARPFEQLALAARPWLPGDMAVRVKYPLNADSASLRQLLPEERGAVLPVMPASPPARY